MGSSSIFVDTSWFKAFADPKDDFHEKAVRQYEKIKTNSLGMVTSNYVLDESFTLIRVRVDLASALDFRKMLLGLRSQLKVIRISTQDDAHAWDWFPNKWSRLSFTDCTSFAVMTRLGLKQVAAFDQHFAQAGFTLFSA